MNYELTFKQNVMPLLMCIIWGKGNKNKYKFTSADS